MQWPRGWACVLNCRATKLELHYYFCVCACPYRTLLYKKLLGSVFRVLASFCLLVRASLSFVIVIPRVILTKSIMPMNHPKYPRKMPDPTTNTKPNLPLLQPCRDVRPREDEFAKIDDVDDAIHST